MGKTSLYTINIIFKHLLRMKALLALLVLVQPYCIYSDVLPVSSNHFPPLTSKVRLAGAGYGLHRDLSEAIIREAGYTPKFSFKPFKRMILEFAKVDNIVLTSRRTLEGFGHSNDSFYGISLGFFYSHYFYFRSHLGHKLDYTEASDLRPYTVCLPLGSFAATTLENVGVTVHSVVNIKQCLQKLVLKRDDIWGSTALTAHYYTAKLFPEKLDDLSHTVATAASSDELLLAFTKTPENKILVAKLNKAYQTLKDNGRVLNIIQQYWKHPVPKRVLPLDMQ